MTAKTLLTIEDFEALPGDVAKNKELVGESWSMCLEIRNTMTTCATN